MKFNKFEKSIIDIIYRSGGTLTINGIAKELSIGNSTVEKYVRGLVTKNLIESYHPKNYYNNYKYWRIIKPDKSNKSNKSEKRITYDAKKNDKKNIKFICSNCETVIELTKEECGALITASAIISDIGYPFLQIFDFFDKFISCCKNPNYELYNGED